MDPDQAANELTEEQLLNFLVNTLDEEIDIELALVAVLILTAVALAGRGR